MKARGQIMFDFNVDVSEVDIDPVVDNSTKYTSHTGETPHYTTVNCQKWTTGRYLSIKKINSDSTME